MGRYALQRLLGVIPLLVVVSVLVFMFIHLIPGDPARLVAGKDATLEEINGIREQLGLNLPLWQQYINYMGKLLQGDLGNSLRSGVPVSDMLKSRFMPTITSYVYESRVGACIRSVDRHDFRGQPQPVA